LTFDKLLVYPPSTLKLYVYELPFCDTSEAGYSVASCPGATVTVGVLTARLVVNVIDTDPVFAGFGVTLSPETVGGEVHIGVQRGYASP
jgi:hypothetical protein